MDAVLLSMPIPRRERILEALRQGQGQDQGQGQVREDHSRGDAARGAAGMDVRRFDRVWGAEREQLLRCAKVGLNIHQWPARVAEVTRLLHYLQIGLPAVSEDGIDYVLESELDEAVSFAPEGQPYLDAVRAAVRSDRLRRRMRSNGDAIGLLRAQRRLLVQTLAALFPGCGARLLLYLQGA